MGLNAHPTIIIPANYEVRQIAMVGARRLADRNIAAAVGSKRRRRLTCFQLDGMKFQGSRSSILACG